MAERPLNPSPFVLTLVVMLAGCAGLPPQPPKESAECRSLFAQLDAAVDDHGVRDDGPARVKEFPYLRVNRLLASFREEVDSEERFDAWSRHMAALDAQSRTIELRNLAVPVAGLDDSALSARLDDCREQLLAAELTLPEMRTRLRKTAQVPDAYVSWWRAAGLYPITAPLVTTRISVWHRETRKVFNTPLQQLPVAGTLVRWGVPETTPLHASQIVEMLKRDVDPLGLPRLTADETQQLFDTFAPLWEVDVASDDDRIGTPYWKSNDSIAVDVGKPAVFRQVSHTRFNGMLLLQLNYIVWFPARSSDDIYAGKLDGINWRVTLGPDGTPWLFDAMHNCGCYYEVFPSPHLKLRDELPSPYSEMPLQPQTAPEGQRMVLRVASTTHYLQRIYTADKREAPSLMAWDDYDTLRALPSPSGNRSLFGKHGIVEASVRPERFTLWPMGVRSAGAMRQWGQHAIAFIGRRHFDDAYLLDTLFEQVPPR